MALYFIPKYRERYSVLKNEELIPLNELSSLTEKIEKLTKMLEIPLEDYDDRKAACTEIYDILKNYYPDCLLLMFGSTVTGFGFKNCDLDLLFLPYPDYSNLECVQAEKPPIPDPASILTGETSKDVLLKFDKWSHLKFARSALRRERTNVRKVTFIPFKNSSLKVFLNNRRAICDVTTGNKLAVFNSELLQFFEKLDPRVKPLVMTLRYWAKSLGFIKRSFFSNYALTLLVIFFLQSTTPSILPSVKRLMQIAGVSRMTEGWQTAFTTEAHLVEKSKNTKSIGELLINFFDYYWNFDYTKNVISPYFGKVMSVKEFKSQDEKMNDFELSYINIQDPFVLSQNLCKIEGPKIVFKLALLIAHHMLKEKNEDFKFNLLFDPAQYQNTLDIHYGRYISGKPKICFISLDYNCLTNLSKIAKDPHYLWYEKATQAIFDILQYGLLMECEVTDKISWGKRNTSANKCNDNGWKQNVPGADSKDKEVSERTPYSLELLQSIQCVLYSRTWIGRKNVTEITVNEDDLDDFNGAALKAEYKISRELVKKNPALNSSVPLLCFRCDCYKHTSPQITDIVVMLKPLTFSREFYQVSSFLASYIPKTVKKSLSAD